MEHLEAKDESETKSDEDYIKFWDKIVRSNREMIVLSILAEKPMCGYDLIKEIFCRSNVLLGQGAIYPILYSLEEDGVVKAEFEKGNMRNKMYCITPFGRDIAQKKLDDFVRAMSHFMQLVKGEKRV